MQNSIINSSEKRKLEDDSNHDDVKKAKNESDCKAPRKLQLKLATPTSVKIDSIY